LKTKTSVLLIILLGTVLSFSVIQCQRAPKAAKVGEPVPDVTLIDTQENKVRISELRGSVVFVNFWASWCKPCEQEAADLESAWRDYQPGGEVIFLGIDWTDTETDAFGYLEKFDISYPNGPDLGTRISQAFRIRGVPETYIIDQDNVLRAVQIGPFRDLSQIQSMIDPLLQ